MVECPICCDVCNKYISCDRGCIMCHDCAKEHFKYYVHIKSGSLKCPGEGCCGYFNESEVKQILSVDPDMYEKFDLQMERSVFLEKGSEFIVECSHCGKWNEISSIGTEYIYFTCIGCDEQTCLTCGNAYFEDHICPVEEYKKSLEDHGNSQSEKLSKDLIRECPKCKTPFIKDDEGCNEVICPVCDSKICYQCGNIINDDDFHYTHGVCRQFEESSVK